MAKEPFDKLNAKKHFDRRVEVEDPQRVDNIQISAFGLRNPNIKVIKYFNCGESRHGVKEC